MPDPCALGLAITLDPRYVDLATTPRPSYLGLVPMFGVGMVVRPKCRSDIIVTHIPKIHSIFFINI